MMDLGCQMSFAGTVAWMAPEVIRNELCNEKVGFLFHNAPLGDTKC